MAVLIDDGFPSNVSAWTVSAGTFSHVASEGSDFDSGYAELATNSTVFQTFTAVSSGLLRLDYWWKDAGTSTGLTHNTLIYLLPNSTITSANSAATIAIGRDAATGASSSVYNLQYRSSAGFLQSINIRRDAWCKISVVLNISARTYDLYINDVLYHRNVASANVSYTSIDRVAIVSQASAPATHFDGIRVESSWSAGESVLIEQDFVGGSGEIEDSVPTTDGRNADPQKWSIPLLTHGGFTLGANGAAPDASKVCMALTRCRPDGIIEIEGKTSVSGTGYLGIVFRTWDHPSSTGAGAGVFRILGGGSNTAALFLPDKDGVLATVQSVAFTPVANTVYTLRVELRGRFVICSTKAATIDSGSYTVRITHQITSSATGGRGMLAEELHGPYISTVAGASDNYVNKFRFTGAISAEEKNDTIGENEYSLDGASIKSLVNASSGGGNQNVFLSRGIQFSHRSRADGNFGLRQKTHFNLTHCKVYEQRVEQMTEYEYVGQGRPWVTLLRRGPWVADNIRTFSTSTFAEYWTPDWDLHGRYFSSGYRYAINTGASVNGTNTSAHDWIADDTNEILPIGFQKVTSFGSGDQLRITQILDSASTNTDSLQGDIATKWEQTADPISLAWAVPPANLTTATEYTCARGFLVERGSLSLSADVIEDWRDSIKTPATITYTTGSVKTNASGDYNSDGFNERHGWFEVNASSDEISISLAHGGVDRAWPVFRIWGLDATSKDVTIAGSLGVSGTDYTLEDMGDGNALLQILSTRTADTTIEVAASGGGVIVALYSRSSSMVGGGTY